MQLSLLFVFIIIITRLSAKRVCFQLRRGDRCFNVHRLYSYKPSANMLHTCWTSVGSDDDHDDSKADERALQWPAAVTARRQRITEHTQSTQASPYLNSTPACLTYMGLFLCTHSATTAHIAHTGHDFAGCCCA